MCRVDRFWFISNRHGIVKTICLIPYTDDYLWCCHHHGPNSDDYIDSGKGRNVYAGKSIRPSWCHVLWFFACRDGYIWTDGRWYSVAMDYGWFRYRSDCTFYICLYEQRNALELENDYATALMKMYQGMVSLLFETLWNLLKPYYNYHMLPAHKNPRGISSRIFIMCQRQDHPQKIQSALCA